MVSFLESMLTVLEIPSAEAHRIHTTVGDLYREGLVTQVSHLENADEYVIVRTRDAMISDLTEDVRRLAPKRDSWIALLFKTLITNQVIGKCPPSFLVVVGTSSVLLTP